MSEARDERFALRLVFISILHEIDNLRYCALTESLGGLHLDNSRYVDTSRYHLVALGNLSWHTLACYRNGV
jgi:hypothetical protein